MPNPSESRFATLPGRRYPVPLSAAVLLLGASGPSPVAPLSPAGHATPAQRESAPVGVLPPKSERLRPVAQSPVRSVRPPNDPLFKHQWHLGAIQIPAAWAASRGAGATVAVLDTGVAYEDRGIHRRAPDLAGTRFTRGWDFVAGDAHPNDVPPPDDDALGARQSHGTHIAGIIAQTTGNGIGAAGVAPGAAIMPIRVLKADQSGSPRTIARGLRFAADHGADVANLSITGREGNRVLEDAIAYASSRGVTIVAAAGNDGRASVGFPAAYPKVVAVGAVSRDRTRAYYSNYGKGLDLVAGGGDGPEDGVLQQTLKGGPSTFCYCFMSSTSAAAAQVAGAAALVVASGRASGPRAVRAALLSSAQDLGPPGRDPEHGEGLVAASDAVAPADASPRPRSTRSRARAPGQPWLVWLALSTAAAGAAVLGGLSLVRRRRRGRWAWKSNGR